MEKFLREKKIDIVIIPQSLSQGRTLSLNKSTFYSFIFFIVLLTFLGIIGTLKYIENINVNRELAKIKSKNDKLIEINNRMKSEIKEISKKESIIREFLGMENKDSKEEMPGKGGPEGENDSDIINTNENKFQMQQESIVNWNFKPSKYPLLVKALILKDRLQEIIDEISSREKYFASRPSIIPVDSSKYYISSGFGYRKSPFTGLRQFHSGIDIVSPRGTPVIATANGKVISVKREGSMGKTIKIRHNKELVTLYGHLLNYAVKRWDKVKRGQVIGYIGSSGLSTGYHLHYEIRKNKKKVNPFNFILNYRNTRLFAGS